MIWIQLLGKYACISFKSNHRSDWLWATFSFSFEAWGPPKKWEISSIFHRGLTLNWRIWTRPGLGGLWCSRALRRKVKPTRTRTAISNTTWVYFVEWYYEKKGRETITILWNLQFDMSWNWNGKLIFLLLKFDKAQKLWALFAKWKKSQ